jgi:HPt (histidine-containing phosphotransfer) domain-containing protein
MASHPLIDHATFEELKAAAGADFVDELIGAFLEESPPLLGELRTAHAESAAERFKRAAHSLKANSQTFGAMVLGAQARALDAACAEAAAVMEALRHG